ncbi:MAG: hypothetical protein GY807_17550 [Gammaproteobacteria bacterium]|nr:hypothetical protein [Gammaproteobacteria bacterium]
MITKQQAIIGGVIIAVMATVLILILWPMLSYAGPPLPPRTPPTPTSSPSSDNDSDGDDGLPAGAYIDLHSPGAAGLWSVVQWQDSDGNWHVVEGWQGILNDQGYRRWWVEAKDFGKGPFRWQVYQHQEGDLRATSRLFHLPQGANKVVKVEVSLEE